MKHYAILAEFEDKRTGERHYAGGTFKPHDEDQRRRLTVAGCLSENPVVVADKPVSEMNRAELEAAAIDAILAEMAERSDDELRNAVEQYRERQRDEDDLSDKTVDELKDIVADEGVDLAGVTRKADIIAKIREKRAGA